jgi:hypothetical protein
MMKPRMGVAYCKTELAVVKMTTEGVRFLGFVDVAVQYFVIREKHRDDVFLWPLSGLTSRH